MPTKRSEAQRKLKLLASRERNLESKSERLRELAIAANEALDEVFQRSNAEQEFNPKSNMPKGGILKGSWGDIGKLRQAEATKLGGFKTGPTVKTAGKF